MKDDENTDISSHLSFRTFIAQEGGGMQPITEELFFGHIMWPPAASVQGRKRASPVVLVSPPEGCLRFMRYTFGFF
jgi:hypothetical protein